MSEQGYPCKFCENSAGLEETLVTLERHRQGRHFIFERVPARVCQHCGQRYFSLDAAEAMDRLMNSPEMQSHPKSIPVIKLNLVR